MVKEPPFQLAESFSVSLIREVLATKFVAASVKFVVYAVPAAAPFKSREGGIFPFKELEKLKRSVLNKLLDSIVPVSYSRVQFPPLLKFAAKSFEAAISTPMVCASFPTKSLPTLFWAT